MTEQNVCRIRFFLDSFLIIITGEMQLAEKEKNIWIVRHGLRVDFTDPDWVKTAENPYNPPLDEKGIKQAEETAVRLMSEQIDYIFTSPFLRTLQTANAIAEKKGMKFNVETGFSEWLKSDEFSYKPELPSPDEMAEKFPFLNTSYESVTPSAYPESRNELDKRTEKVLSEIINKYNGNILIISHGSPIKSIYKSLINVVPDDYQPMCSVSLFSLVSGEWKLEINSDSSHLTLPDITQRAFYLEKGSNY